MRFVLILGSPNTFAFQFVCMGMCVNVCTYIHQYVVRGGGFYHFLMYATAKQMHTLKNDENHPRQTTDKNKSNVYVHNIFIGMSKHTSRNAGVVVLPRNQTKRINWYTEKILQLGATDVVKITRTVTQLILSRYQQLRNDQNFSKKI